MEAAADLGGEVGEIAGDGVLQRLLILGQLRAAFVGIAGDHLDGVEALIEAGGAVGGGGGERGDVVAEDGDVELDASECAVDFLLGLLERGGGVGGDALHLTHS